MSVNLTYDDVNAKVGIVADAVANADYATIERSTDQLIWTTIRGGVVLPISNTASIVDTFNRTVSNGWGNADTGQAWTTTGGSASDFSVSGGIGRHSLGTVAVTRRSAIGSAITDSRQSLTVTVSAVALTQPINVRIFVRSVDASNQWRIRLQYNPDGTVDLSLGKVIVGAVTTVATQTNVTTYVADSAVFIIFRVVGDTFQVKVWRFSEPSDWTIVYTEYLPALLSGAVGFETDLTAGNTNTLPVIIRFSSYTMALPQVVLDDYEFIPGVTNYYRVRGVETDPIVFVGSGATVTDANAAGTSTLSPALPANIAAGDLLLIMASIRNSGTGTVNVPAGWSTVFSIAGGNVAIVGRRYVDGDAAPTITFSNGVANATIIAKCFAFRSADLVTVSTNAQLNGSAQNVAYPQITPSANNLLVLVGCWKQDVWTGIAQLAGMTEIHDAFTSLGDDASQGLDYVVQTAATVVPAGSFTVTGGISAISRGFTVTIGRAPFLNEQINTVLPALSRIWIKSPTRPFLNRPVTVVDWSAIRRGTRSIVNQPIGRSVPIAVTDIGGAREFALTVYTATDADTQTIDYIIASGDVLFVHAPLGCRVPGGYVRIGETSQVRVRPRGISQLFTLPCAEVAAPGPDVVYAASTWQTVLNTYANWSAVLAANPTWATLLSRLAPPSSVIVP
jgi:hypothetical protein